MFWTQTSGTWINVITIILGTVIGLSLRDRLPKPMQRVITQGLGLVPLLIGMEMGRSLFDLQAGAVDGVIVGLMSLVGGGLLGEWWGVEGRLEAVGDWLKRRFRGQGHFTDGFVAASLLFCIGPLALIGSLNNGLTGDNTLLVIKASMDGLAAIAFTSTFGMGVGFSALPVLLYQGGLSLGAAGFAQILPDPATSPTILAATGVGGVIIVGLGLTLLEATQIRIASLLPALLLAPLLYLLGTLLTTAPG
ncbi:MAG: DUF554 domain-containing protein [Elainellaceae cyanobacterium]